MNKIIFILSGNEIIGAEMIDKINAEKGEITIKKFPDGETYVKINNEVKNKDVIIVCTLHKPDDKILTLYFVCSELKNRGAKKITLVAPYLSYMRQDKEFKTGEVITANHFANLISTFIDHLITIDPHLHRNKSMNAIYPISSTVLHSAPLISAYIKTNIINPLIIGPDEESEQWVAEIAENADAPYVVSKKIRSDDRNVSITIPALDKYIDHTPVIMDDIISTAHTMIETVRVLNKSGMKVPVCIGVHAVFSANAYGELNNCGAEKIITCNTIQHSSNVIDVSELIIQQLNLMINSSITWALKNKMIVLLLAAAITLFGIYSVKNTPVDAIPDLSENQVIIFTEWMGRSPQLIEDQITYKLVSNLQGIPKVKNIRGSSMFGMSFVFVIFDDDADIYWARTRVLERLNSTQQLLPDGVTPTLGPDGTGLGHIFWYTLDAPGYDLGELRAIQDWYIRFALQTVDGVSEVASFGGFQKQYQVVIDPFKLRYYDISLMEVVEKIKANNNDVGGRKFEQSDIGYIVRGLGYIKNISEIENIALKTINTTPIYVKDVASVQTGGELRLGIIDENGEGEKVGGIVIMRYGENAKDVIKRVKEKIIDVEKGLPKGVKLKIAYDRSGLIDETISTLSSAVTEEIIIVAIVLFIFLLHVRSSIIVIITIPVSILIAFILMKIFGITSNIMSLAGVALAVGDLVDAGIVMVENAMKEIGAEKNSGEINISDLERKKRIEISSKLIGRAVFNSILVTLVSFSPILFLEGQEHKLFSPLVWTKTFAMIGSAFVAIFLVPVLMIVLLKGKIRSESKHPVSRFFIWIYTPVIRWCLRWKKLTITLCLALVGGSVPLVLNLGTEFMPPLDEGSLLFMPVTMPDVSNSEVKRIMQVQDKLILSVPEVENVLGKAGRANTATDNAPMSMIETIILLKPRSEWRSGITKNDIINELNSKMQIPGVINGWTQPIINRVNMLSTGIRTDVGIKIYGQDLDTINKYAQLFKKELEGIEGIKDLYVEPIVGGKYLDFKVRKEEIGKYGLTTDDVNMFIETALGGMNVTTTIEGRERFSVNVRFGQDYRDNVQKLNDLQIQTMQFGPIPLSSVADIFYSEGPPMINSENAMLRGTLLFNVRDRDMGSTVKDAKSKLEKFIETLPEKKLPGGYFLDWSGQYENQVRAQNRLMYIIPVVLIIIMIILYFTFKSFREVFIVLCAIPVALVGGAYSLYFYDVNFSVAVAVGFIALFGVAVETGVLMVVYLNNSVLNKVKSNTAENKITNKNDIEDAIYDGAALRLRPKLMTVLVDIIGLLPVLLATGTGSDVMKPITIPFVFGLITSTLFVLIVLPVVYALMKEFELKKHGKISIQEFDE